MNISALNYINLKLAIEKGLVTVTQVVDYLKDIRCTLESLVMYTDVCRADPSGMHYTSSGVHFLASFQLSLAYRLIYFELGLPALPIYKKDVQICR